MRLVVFSGQFIHPELQVLFGKIIPIELPVANKSLMERIDQSVKNHFPKKTILIPENYVIPAKFIPIDWEIKKINQNFKLIDVFQFVANEYKEEKLFLHYGDSIFDFDKIEYADNSILVGKARFNYHWGIVNDNQVFTGGMCIDGNLLARLVKNCFDFSDALEKFKVNLKISNTEYWLDFGHSMTYFESRKYFLETRNFNDLKMDAGFILKSSTDIFKMYSEYEWLRKLSKIIPHHIPALRKFRLLNSTKAEYGLEYLKYLSLAEIYVFGKNTEEFYRNLFEELKKLLNSIRSANTKFSESKIPNLYTAKLTERKSEIFSSIDKLKISKENFEKIFEENFNYFSGKNQKITIMHGDYCFSNILFDIVANKPYLIDPRGYISKNQEPTILGPYLYDEVKLAHSFVCQYDFIIAGRDIDYKTFDRRIDFFLEYFQMEKEFLLHGLINLFLTMIPLHSDSKERQLKFVEMVTYLNRQK